MALAQYKNIPERISDAHLLLLMKTKKVDGRYVSYIKDLTNTTDELISDWLNINVKTFRSYKQSGVSLKENLQEQIILLISLFKHGEQVFGDIALFNTWLNSENFYLDNELPIRYLKTVTGIRFIEDRLTALEYGDNI